MNYTIAKFVRRLKSLVVNLSEFINLSDNAFISVK